MLQALKDVVQKGEETLTYKRTRISVEKIYKDEIFSIKLSNS
ncbi:hypothetical protein [Serpentinicella alkaliphila]|nr:hypothetical protein [Serpentinicella alkaliphila]